MRLYRLPGYGRIYGLAQRWIHSHGYCILAVQPQIDERVRWYCSWCGHRASETMLDRKIRDCRDDAELHTLLRDKVRQSGFTPQ